MTQFKECADCAAKPGTPTLCEQCLWVRENYKQKPMVKITIETARRNIAEWLYVNDGVYNNKIQWRTALLEMLEWNFKRLK